MSERSVSIPEDVYTELERVGIITAHLAGQPEPFTPSEVMVMIARQYVAKLDTIPHRNGDVYMSVPLSICTGQGELKCTLQEYVKKKGIRMKTLQQASRVPTSTLYAIASGSVPTLDSFLRLLPGLDFPPLSEILKRS